MPALLAACDAPGAEDGADAPGAEAPGASVPAESSEPAGPSFVPPAGSDFAERKELKPDDEYQSASTNKGGLLQRSEQSAAEMFIWAANEADVVLKPRDTHICFLTKVSGNFGGVSAVAVHRSTQDIKFRCGSQTRLDQGLVFDDAASVWKLGGCQKQSNSLGAEATCVPLSSFTTVAGGVKAISPVFNVANMGAGVETVPVDMWDPWSASYIAGVMGYFDGGGEKLQVVYDYNAWRTQMLATETVYWWANRANVQGRGYSFFFGAHGQPHAVLRASGFSRNSKDGSNPQPLRMISTSSGVCYLSSVSGSLDGGGERIRIFPQKDAWGVENWMLEARSQSGGSAYGSAECVYYDQRNLPAPL